LHVAVRAEQLVAAQPADARQLRHLADDRLDGLVVLPLLLEGELGGLQVWQVELDLDADRRRAGAVPRRVLSVRLDRARRVQAATAGGMVGVALTTGGTVRGEQVG